MRKIDVILIVVFALLLFLLLPTLYQDVMCFRSGDDIDDAENWCGFLSAVALFVGSVLLATLLLVRAVLLKSRISLAACSLLLLPILYTVGNLAFNSVIGGVLTALVATGVLIYVVHLKIK